MQTFTKEDEFKYFSNSLRIICVAAVVMIVLRFRRLSITVTFLLFLILTLSIPAMFSSFGRRITSISQKFQVVSYVGQVATMLYVLKLLSVASEVGGILSTETATFASFEP